MPPIEWEQLSIVAALGLAVTAFVRGWVVSGTTFQQLLSIHRALLSISDKQADTLEQLARHSDERDKVAK